VRQHGEISHGIQDRKRMSCSPLAIIWDGILASASVRIIVAVRAQCGGRCPASYMLQDGAVVCTAHNKRNYKLPRWHLGEPRHGLGRLLRVMEAAARTTACGACQTAAALLQQALAERSSY
jgi:hypothetical protein